MIGDRQAIARLQCDVYRDQFRKLLRWLIVAVAIIFLLIFTMFYWILVQPEQHYYGNTTSGMILPMPNANDTT